MRTLRHIIADMHYCADMHAGLAADRAAMMGLEPLAPERASMAHVAAYRDAIDRIAAGKDRRPRMDRAPADTEFDDATKLQAMTALHGSRATPKSVPPRLATQLMDEGVVAYTDIGWTLTQAGYRKLAAAEGTDRGAAFASAIDDQAVRIQAVEAKAKADEAA